MPEIPRSPKVKFAFMAIGLDPESEHTFFSFDVAGDAPAHAIIKLKADEAKGERNHLAILPHDVDGQFNVLACSVRGKSVNYSFTHVGDTLQLGEHLRELGVSEKIIATFNQLKPEQAVPVKTAAVDHEAAGAIAKAMGGKLPKGRPNTPE